MKLNFSGDDEMRTGGPWIHCGFFEHAVHAAMVHDMHMIRKGFSKVGDQTGAKWPLNFPDRLPTFEEAQVMAGITPAPAVAASASALSSSSSSLSSSSGAISRTGAELTELLAARQYKGVTWHDRKKQWQARFDLGTSHVHLGFFGASVKASHAYDAFAKTKGSSKERALDAAVQSSAASVENVADFAVTAPPASKKKRRRRSGSSTYFGVYWNKRAKKWRTQVWNNLTKKMNSLGSFASEVDAARAVDAYIVKCGLARELNFPRDHITVATTAETNAARAVAPSASKKKKTAAGGSKRSSKFGGVSWIAVRKRWLAQCHDRNGGQIFLGSFANEADAARAVDAYIVKCGLDRPLNFPDEHITATDFPATTQTAPLASKKKRKRKSSSSKYFGVTWSGEQRNWEAQLWDTSTSKEHFMKHLGYFRNEVDAARAVDAYIVKRGPDRELNFPDEHIPAALGILAAASAARITTAPGALAAASPALFAPTKRKSQAKHGNNSSKFIGVCWLKSVRRWRAQLYVDGKTKYVGTFVDETDAARAVDAFIVENSIEKALNFPSAVTSSPSDRLLPTATPLIPGGTAAPCGSSVSKQQRVWAPDDRVAAKSRNYKGWWAGRVVVPPTRTVRTGFVCVVWDGSHSYNDVKNTKTKIVRYDEAMRRGLTVQVEETPGAPPVTLMVPLLPQLLPQAQPPKRTAPPVRSESARAAKRTRKASHDDERSVRLPVWQQPQLTLQGQQPQQQQQLSSAGSSKMVSMFPWPQQPAMRRGLTVQVEEITGAPLVTLMQPQGQSVASSSAQELQLPMEWLSVRNKNYLIARAQSNS